MVHQSGRRCAPPARDLRVGRYLTSRTFHLTLQRWVKGATIDLGESLQPHSNPIPSDSKNPAGGLQEMPLQLIGSSRLSSTASLQRRFSVSLNARRSTR